jgi:hypothetical protein
MPRQVRFELRHDRFAGLDARCLGHEQEGCGCPHLRRGCSTAIWPRASDPALNSQAANDAARRRGDIGSRLRVSAKHARAAS